MHNLCYSNSHNVYLLNTNSDFHMVFVLVICYIKIFSLNFDFRLRFLIYLQKPSFSGLLLSQSTRKLKFSATSILFPCVIKKIEAKISIFVEGELSYKMSASYLVIIVAVG